MLSFLLWGEEVRQMLRQINRFLDSEPSLWEALMVALAVLILVFLIR